MTAPHITITHSHILEAMATIDYASAVCSATLCNKAIEIALAEQATEQYITAEEARKLGAGKAEFLGKISGNWVVCESYCRYKSDYKYRAIKQPEPAIEEVSLSNAIERSRAFYKPEPAEPHAELKAMYEQQVKDGTLDDFVWEIELKNSKSWTKMTGPHLHFSPDYKYRCTPKPTCQVRNLDTGELKTITREAAKKLWDELGYTVEWFSGRFHTRFPADQILKFDDTKDGCHKSEPAIYTYKLKANLVKLDGELMTREAAITKYEAVKGTCDIWIKNDVTIVWTLTELPCKFIVYAHECNCEYQLRAKPLKQVSWKDVPVGVMTNYGVFHGVFDDRGMVKQLSKLPHYILLPELTLAPASEHPWLVYIQGETDLSSLKGVEIELRIVNKVFEDFVTLGFDLGRYNELKHRIVHYRITGLASGYGYPEQKGGR